MTTLLSPYLNFNGQCREALSFYHQCIGGELTLQKVSESPMAAQMPSEAGSHILHGSLVNKGVTLMASDMMGPGLVNGNSITLCMTCTSEEEVTTFFSRLSAGGKVKTPLHQSFWGATYGELTDKFGMNWMFNFTKHQQ